MNLLKKINADFTCNLTSGIVAGIFLCVLEDAAAHSDSKNTKQKKVQYFHALCNQNIINNMLNNQRCCLVQHCACRHGKQGNQIQKTVTFKITK